MESTGTGTGNQDRHMSSNSENEVSLVQSNDKPGTTEELVSMLKTAGKELTIKYITGEMNNIEFFAQLEKMKAKQQVNEKSASNSYSGQDFVDTSKNFNLVDFDRLLEDESEGRSDDSDNDLDEGSLQAGEEGMIEDESNDLMDESLEKVNDEDWLPDKSDLQQMRRDERQRGNKSPSRGKGKGKGKRTSDIKDDKTVIKKVRKKRRKESDLPPHLESENGRAMLLRAQGKIEESMMLLMDIIGKAPKASAPYQALGSIHEEQGNEKQALKFYMLAANLGKSDMHKWFQLIDMCLKLQDEKKALVCFSKAMRYATKGKDKLEILMRKSAFFEQLNTPIKALPVREQMLRYMDRGKPEAILSCARTLAKDYLEIDDVINAVSTLQYIHKELSKDIDSEDVNLLVELLMSQSNYTSSLEVLIKHCGIDIRFYGWDGPSKALDLLVLQSFANKDISLESVHLPDLMPIDLKSKFVQATLLIKALPTPEVLEDILQELVSSDVEEYGDIHLDVAEALMDCSFPERARPILHALVHSENFSKAAVWLMYGQCLNSLGDIEPAAQAYGQVVEMAPGHYGARVTLSSLQQQMGQNEVALETLSKGRTDDTRASSDQLLLLRKCQLLHTQGKMEEFIKTSRSLLSFNMQQGMCTPDFIKVLVSVRTLKHRKNRFPLIMSGKKPGSDNHEDSTEELTELQKRERKKFRDEVWEVFTKLCYVMYDKGMKDEVLEMAMLATTCPTFHDEQRVKDVEFLCLKLSSLYKKDTVVHTLLKNLIKYEIDNDQAWNLYCYIQTQFQEVSDCRFAMRTLMKKPNNVALAMLNGNTRFISGTYKQALGEFLAVFQKQPNNDLAALMCALSLLSIHCQSFTLKKNLLTPQVMCFLRIYCELRGENQETYYNMGRAMFQLNFQFAAVHYYKKALEFPPIVGEENGRFDLRREIAFNLSVIFRRSGSPEYARYYIEKYCVV